MAATGVEDVEAELVLARGHDFLGVGGRDTDLATTASLQAVLVLFALTLGHLALDPSFTLCVQRRWRYWFRIRVRIRVRIRIGIRVGILRGSSRIGRRVFGRGGVWSGSTLGTTAGEQNEEQRQDAEHWVTFSRSGAILLPHAVRGIGLLRRPVAGEGMSTENTPLRWAIIGVGRAGRARARGIARDRRSELVAVHRGKYAADAGAPQMSLEDAIASADAVAICTPDELHVSMIEIVLRAGRHVVVEYPIAAAPADAERLFALSDEVGRVLHVEHIELLHSPQQILRAHARRELQQSLKLTFERQGTGEEGAEEILRSNIARLHRLVDIGGPVASIERVEVSPGRVAAALTFATGIEASIDFQAGPYFNRQTVFIVDATAHVWKLHNDALYRGRGPLTTLEPTPLFEQDHLAATARIIDGRKPYVDRRRILHVLELATSLTIGATGPFSGQTF